MIETFLLFYKPFLTGSCLLLLFTRYTFDLSMERVLSNLVNNFGCYGYLSTTRAVPMATIYPLNKHNLYKSSCVTNFKSGIL